MIARLLATLAHPLALPTLLSALWWLAVYRAISIEENRRDDLATEEAWAQGEEILNRGKARTSLHGRGAVLRLRD
jgi:hypothetical protein